MQVVQIFLRMNHSQISSKKDKVEESLSGLIMRKIMKVGREINLFIN